MNIVLEKAEKKDIPLYLEIESSVIGNKIYSGISSMEEAEREFNKEYIFFIYVDTIPVGTIQYQEKNPKHAYISGVVIKKEFQGKGYGTLATKMLLERMRQYTTIDLVTHPDNITAIRLYTSLGFKKGEIIKNYFGDGEPRMYMILEK